MVEDYVLRVGVMEGKSEDLNEWGSEISLVAIDGGSIPSLPRPLLLPILFSPHLSPLSSLIPSA